MRSTRQGHSEFGSAVGRERGYGAAVPAVMTLAAALGGCGRGSLEEPSQVPPTAEQPERSPLSASAAHRGPSGFVALRAPAGDRPPAQSTTLDGRAGAILPNGRFVSPAGTEVAVGAPKPFGLALSPDGKTAATINSGASHFSVTLVTNLGAA